MHFPSRSIHIALGKVRGNAKASVKPSGCADDCSEHTAGTVSDPPRSPRCRVFPSRQLPRRRANHAALPRTLGFPR